MLIQATQTWTMPVESTEWRPSERAVRGALFSLALGMSLLLVSTPAVASAVAGQPNATAELNLLQGFEFLFFFAGIAIAPAMILVCASLARIGLTRVGWMDTDLLDDELDEASFNAANETALATASVVPSAGFGEGKVNLPMNCNDKAA